MSLNGTDEYVCYASYGSNLNYNRFKCYLKGGTPEGLNIEMFGSRDSSSPLKYKLIKLEYKLYFAKYSSGWNGGVCFIKKNNEETFFRLYLIKSEQFKDVAHQECGLRPEKININLDEARKSKELIFSEKWYGRILYLGKESNIPIFTVTSPKDFSDKLREPSLNYLHHIVTGLKKYLELREIFNYLNSKEGMIASRKLKRYINRF